jgi:hypothetical protein
MSLRDLRTWASALALLILAVLGVLFLRRDPVPHLRIAEVPVHPRIHHPPDPERNFPETFPLQVAVLLTGPQEGLLGLTHSLQGMGIPFFVTRDFNRALAHRLVVLYPTVVAQTFADEQVRVLTRHVAQGGSLLAQNVLAPALRTLFGFSGVQPSRRRYRVVFSGDPDPLLKYFDRPEEKEIRLGKESYPEIFWTNGYAADSAARVLARFEDGSAALLEKRTGGGNAYVVGADFKDLVLRCQVNRDYDAERNYVNAFEPGADVWMLLLRAWYESASTDAVRLATIPDGLRSVLLLSHDVDWEYAVTRSIDFTRMESSRHVSSTFFIQTKYVSDANSRAFFFGSNLDILRELRAGGFSLGSHSIIHAREFNKFALGSGAETFASYRPAVRAYDHATGTVFGEVRVSKELLDGEIPGQQTDFFRAGHLRFPFDLPEALERCGYAFDSSFTAPDVLTNFPYALPLDAGFVEDSGLYEFPVTIDDSGAPALGGRIPQALDIIRANADNAAISVLLVHTDDPTTKVPAEDALLAQLPADVRAQDMESFAKFWRARDRLRWSVIPAGRPGEVLLKVRSAEPVRGLTFEFADAVVAVADRATLLPDRHRIVLPPLVADKEASFLVRTAP